MPRFALKIEYDGGPFSGWQRQVDQPSVQAAIEAALAKLEKADHKIAAAGRTDAGVHALAQVAHCDLSRAWDPFRLSEAINFHLKPLPIAIIDCARVADDWHARFSAVERQYLFKLFARRAPLTFDEGTMWRVTNPLDGDAMQRGAEHLLGHHDFTTFRATMCQAPSPMKTVDEVRVEQIPSDTGQLFHIHVRARSFLHNQVRSFVGTLERVGAGAWHPDDVKTALDARARTACGPVCPPHGLYLADVIYPVTPFNRP